MHNNNNPLLLSAMSDTSDLRRQAEKKTALSTETIVHLSLEDTRKIIHDLGIHQIELEMQNEELRQKQNELDAVRMRYFHLYDLAPAGYLTLGEKGLILKANLWAATILGVPRGKLVGQPISKFIHKDDQDAYYLFQKQLFAKGESQSHELRMVKSDNVPFCAQVSAIVDQDTNGVRICQLVLIDITERKQAEQYRGLGLEVFKICNRAEIMQENVQRVITALKKRTGFDAVGIRLQTGVDFPYYAQDGFSQNFLLTENTLITHGADDMILHDKNGNACLECACGLVISGKTDPSNPLFTHGGSFWTNDALQLRALPPDQDPRYHPRNRCIHDGYASIALIPIRNKDRIVGLLHLVDHRKGCFTLAIIELLENIATHIGEAVIRKRAEDELQKMDKIQSIGTLAGGIAHDFNNILTGLFGNISLAMEDLSKTHPSYAFLDEAGKSMNRAVKLTKQLLTFAKGGDPVKENITLGNMVEEVARFDLSGSNVSLVYHSADDLWSINADKGQIQQAVSNLVINARQAMPKGGRLIVTLENADISEAAVSMLSPGRYAKVTVQDEGEGISPKVFDHIFDPYFTTKKTGNGLGLTTVWSIISKHGGHIDVISELGKGATFTFYLPASSSVRATEAKQPATECTPPARPAKILVMDDDDAVSKILVRLLTSCGHTVVTVPDGQEAVALYQQALEARSPFDVVILDLTIPGGPGGAEVIKDLLALDPRVRAIVSSGYADDPVMANPTAYGFKCTVAKPYTAKALRETVARVLA